MAPKGPWAPKGPKGPEGPPLPWALGPEALRAGEPEKNKERHYGVTSPLRCDLAPLKGRGGCAATRSRINLTLLRSIQQLKFRQRNPMKNGIASEMLHDSSVTFTRIANAFHVLFVCLYGFLFGLWVGWLVFVGPLVRWFVDSFVRWVAVWLDDSFVGSYSLILSIK